MGAGAGVGASVVAGEDADVTAGAGVGVSVAASEDADVTAGAGAEVTAGEDAEQNKKIYISLKLRNFLRHIVFIY